MEPLGVWWAIAGGWAIDLWLGQVTRDHHDVEVAIRRHDQAVVHRKLAVQRDMLCIDPPGSGWRTWRGEEISRPSFQTKARLGADEFDLFLEDVEHDQWVFRRDPAVRRPFAEIAEPAAGRLPVLRPEIQLLYMAGHDEPKNQQDFAHTLPHLGAQAREWLHESLERAAPGHRWIDDLRQRIDCRTAFAGPGNLCGWTMRCAVEVDVGELCLDEAVDVPVHGAVLPPHLCSGRAHPDAEQVADPVLDRCQTIPVFVRPRDRRARRLASELDAIARDQRLTETPSLQRGDRIAIHGNLSPSPPPVPTLRKTLDVAQSFHPGRITSGGTAAAPDHRHEVCPRPSRGRGRRPVAPSCPRRPRAPGRPPGGAAHRATVPRA